MERRRLQKQVVAESHQAGGEPVQGHGLGETTSVRLPRTTDGNRGRFSLHGEDGGQEGIVAVVVLGELPANTLG